MTGTSWRIVRIKGVEYRLDLTWVLVAVGLAYGTFGLLRNDHPHVGRTTPYGFAAAAIVVAMFAAALLLHELAHVVVRRAFRQRVERTTFWGLGTLSVASQEPPSPSAEAVVAAAGVVANGAAALALALVARALPPGHLHRAAVIWALVNLLIAGANVLPAHGMDGNEVLRAVTWKAAGDRVRAGRVALSVGRVFGVVVALAATVPALHLQIALTIMIAVTGLYIAGAATSELKPKVPVPGDGEATEGEPQAPEEKADGAGGPGTPPDPR